MYNLLELGAHNAMAFVARKFGGLKPVDLCYLDDPKSPKYFTDNADFLDSLFGSQRLKTSYDYRRINPPSGPLTRIITVGALTPNELRWSHYHKVSDKRPILSKGEFADALRSFSEDLKTDEGMTRISNNYSGVWYPSCMLFESYKNDNVDYTWKNVVNFRNCLIGLLAIAASKV